MEILHLHMLRTNKTHMLLIKTLNKCCYCLLAQNNLTKTKLPKLKVYLTF